MYSFYSNIIRVTYFCVLFGEKVDKRKSSMCSRLRQLLRKSKCFDFSESATKKKYNFFGKCLSLLLLSKLQSFRKHIVM